MLLARSSSVGAHVDILPIRAARARHPVPLNPAPQDRHRGPDGFLRGKQPQRRPRRIVHQRQQAGHLRARFEPRVRTAIQLQQLARVRHALPPPPVGRSCPRRLPQPRRQHPAPQGFMMHRESILTR